MLAAIYDEFSPGCLKQLEILEVDNEILRKAQETFVNYKNRKVILNDNFKDSVWNLSNEKRHYKMDFTFSEEEFKNNGGKWAGCSYKCYVECIKAYLVFSLGRLELASICAICNVLKRMMGYSQNNILDLVKYINHIVSFLKILPNSTLERDYVIEILEDKWCERSILSRKGNQRCLSDFKSYLKFDKMLNVFWNHASEKEKLVYFPVYLWWKVTSILPLRPTEFLLTPRNCLSYDEDGNSVLTIRRTRLKGGHKKITYNIEGDYIYKKYIIKESVAEEIRKYIQATETMKKTSFNTLLSKEPYRNCIGKNFDSTYNYFTYGNLTFTLNSFYEKILINSGESIRRVNLGDTRHLAMVNLILTGGSPTICMELAGHSDINISSHYYTNISNLVECITLEKYRERYGKKANMKGKVKYETIIPDKKHRVENGWCDAMEVLNGNISECVKAANNEGNIGVCSSCIHYWPDVQGIRFEFFDTKKGKAQVDADSAFLVEMIERTRKGLGYTEELKKAFLKLQHSSNHYSKCLWEKYSSGRSLL